MFKKKISELDLAEYAVEFSFNEYHEKWLVFKENNSDIGVDDKTGELELLSAAIATTMISVSNILDSDQAKRVIKYIVISVNRVDKDNNLKNALASRVMDYFETLVAYSVDGGDSMFLQSVLSKKRFGELKSNIVDRTMVFYNSTAVISEVSCGHVIKNAKESLKIVR